MKEILPDIDKLFKDAMDQHIDHPSSKVWDHIENDLDRKSVIQITKRYDQLKRVAVVLALLFGTALAYLLLKPISPDGLASHTKAVKNTIQSNNSKSDDLNEIKSGIKNNDSNDLITSNNSRNGLSEHESKDLSASGYAKNKELNKISNNRNPSDLTKSNTYSVVNHSAKKGSLNNLFSKNLKEKSIDNIYTFNNNDELKETLLYNTESEHYHFGDDVFTTTLTNNSKELPRSITNSSLEKVITVNPKKYKPSLLSRFSIAANYSPDFSFNTLRDDKPHGPDMDRRHIKDNEKHAFSYSTGVSANFDINKHLTVQAGLAYSQSTIDNRPKRIVAEKDNNGDVKYRFDASCGYGYILPRSAPPPHVGDTLNGVSSTSLLKYIQVPVAIKYSITKGRIGFNSLVGISFNTLKSGQLNTTINNGSIKESQTINSVEGLKKHSTTALLGAGIEYHLNNKLSLNFTPTLRLALSSINSGAVVKSYPTNIGLSSGIRIRL